MGLEDGNGSRNGRLSGLMAWGMQRGEGGRAVCVASPGTGREPPFSSCRGVAEACARRSCPV